MLRTANHKFLDRTKGCTKRFSFEWTLRLRIRCEATAKRAEEKKNHLTSSMLLFAFFFGEKSRSTELCVSLHTLHSNSDLDKATTSTGDARKKRKRSFRIGPCWGSRGMESMKCMLMVLIERVPIPWSGCLMQVMSWKLFATEQKCPGGRIGSLNNVLIKMTAVTRNRHWIQLLTFAGRGCRHKFSLFRFGRRGESVFVWLVLSRSSSASQIN